MNWNIANGSSKRFIGILILLCVSYSMRAQGEEGRSLKDVVYATVGEKALLLDLYMPAGVANPRLLIWVHGGAWRFGSKARYPGIFVENGVAVASLDFRQSTEAPFPAAVHDIKAAIRFLRAKALEFGYRSERFAIGGDSSGGHLAALVGVSNGDEALEGTVGNYLSHSSEIHAIIDYYGASNLNTILAQSTPHGLKVRRPALELLLGDLPENVPDIAERASPVAHVDPGDPPLLLIHGDQDKQMPVNQALELFGKYKKVDGDVALDVVYGGGHGGDVFYSGEHFGRALAFLNRVIGK